MAVIENPIAKLDELIDGIEIAILTTIRPDSTLHSCPMASRGVDENGVFWFISNSNTEKVEAVRTIQRVNLCFSDNARQRYVSVSGFCELVRDTAMTRALWNKDYQSWFPKGLDDPDLVLLKIVVQQAEYWDPQRACMAPVAGFTEVSSL